MQCLQAIEPPYLLRTWIAGSEPSASGCGARSQQSHSCRALGRNLRADSWKIQFIPQCQSILLTFALEMKASISIKKSRAYQRCRIIKMLRCMSVVIGVASYGAFRCSISRD